MKILPYKGKTKWVLRGVVVLSTILNAWILHDQVGEPGRPIHIALANGFIASAIMNLGWFIGTFEVKSFLRFFLALYLLPAALGIAIAVDYYFHILAAIMVIFLHLWLIVCLVFYKMERHHEESKYN